MGETGEKFGRGQFLTLNEIKRGESDIDIDEEDDPKERETYAPGDPRLTAPPAPISYEALKDGKKEIPTLIPPPLDGVPTADNYVAKIYQKESDEIPKLEKCRKRLVRIAGAISNREINPDKALIWDKRMTSIYPLAFPFEVGGKMVMRVFAFDRRDNFSELAEITEALMGLTSLKNSVADNLSLVERRNLVKALTEYMEDLIEIAPVDTDEKKMNLGTDYLKASNSLIKLSFVKGLVRGPEPLLKVDGDMLEINQDFLGIVKKRMSRFMFDKFEHGRDPVASITHGLRSIIRPRIETEADVELKRHLEEVEQAVSRVDKKIAVLRGIANNICDIVGSMNPLYALDMALEITQRGPIDGNQYVSSFELLDEVQGHKLAQRIAIARLEVRRMQLSEDILYNILGTFLGDPKARTPEDARAKMIKIEK